MNEENHIMLDLETLGKRPGCVVVSIGAVRFGPSGVGSEEFYSVLDRDAQQHRGLHIDPDTEEWWARQSDEARAVFNEPQLQVEQVLHAFNNFIGPSAHIWGNGANFDEPILTEVFRVFEINQRWAFWRARCHRTLVKLAPEVARPAPTVAHNALADAKAQAQHAVDVMRILKIW